MKDLDEDSKFLESQFGLISGYAIYCLHKASTAAGANWDINDPDTMEIIVNKSNAENIYAICKDIRSGYSVGLNKDQKNKVKVARSEAHKHLFAEANDPLTPITRKIELVKLTSKS